jgi:predicted DNA-binding transcriptional regulator AlpA
MKRYRDDPGQMFFCFTGTMEARGDGTYVLKPGRPRMEISAAEVAHVMGVHRNTVYAYAECGILTARRPSPSRMVFSTQEVEEVMRKTLDPEFWERNGKVLRDLRVKRRRNAAITRQMHDEA